MAKVITLSRQFPSYHPKAGQPTYFVSSAWRSIGLFMVADDAIQTLLSEYRDWGLPDINTKKRHTVRLGRRWKDGDMASLRVWSGRPYNSPQIKIADDVKVRVVDIVLDFKSGLICRNEGGVIHIISAPSLAANDGLSLQDFLDWFKYKENRKKGVAIQAQILIWGDVKEY
jgi:hypothetical protein